MAREFNGTIKLDVRDSVADWDAFTAKRATEGAPDVLVVLYDDTGLAAWSPYGGRIEMPAMQRLADTGVTYSPCHGTRRGPTRRDELRPTQGSYGSVAGTPLTGA